MSRGWGVGRLRADQARRDGETQGRSTRQLLGSRMAPWLARRSEVGGLGLLGRTAGFRRLWRGQSPRSPDWTKSDGAVSIADARRQSTRRQSTRTGFHVVQVVDGDVEALEL
jgi:hypothetical protein